uniref:DECOY n=1 Tax=Solanum tuberosum TaxID=4113 RepID=M1ATL4_SOLTU
MQRCCSSAGRSAIGKRWFSSSNNDKIVASVLFERLPVVVPTINPTVYAFQEFS